MSRSHKMYAKYLPPGSAETAAGLRGNPSIFAMSNTGFPVRTLALVSVADAKFTVWSFRWDDGGGRGGGRGGGGGGGGHALASNFSCNWLTATEKNIQFIICEIRSADDNCFFYPSRAVVPIVCCADRAFCDQVPGNPQTLYCNLYFEVTYFLNYKNNCLLKNRGTYVTGDMFILYDH